VTRPLILLTNDDGVMSPGLAASAAALAPLGDLLIVAPREQQSGMGRSMPSFHDGRLFETTIHYDGQSWPAYGASASPAQAVLHGVLELADRRPALVVSGINYGENVGTGITASGTVGAALEAAANDIPALAVSLQTDQSQHMTNDPAVDFCTAIYFTRLFAQRWLAAERLPDVDVLKIDIPASATPDTPWVITRLQKGKYYTHLPPLRKRLDDEGRIGYMADPRIALDLDSDAKGILDGLVTVTPLSLDITSRIAPDALHRVLNNHRD
jgi:5'-nucleotidase